MTYREKFYQDHADMEPEEAKALLDNSCPQRFYYAVMPEYCIDGGNACVECWNREVPCDYEKTTVSSVTTVNSETPAEDFTIIDIPADGSYVEILGHRITGDFKTFEGFLEYLRDLETTKREYEKLMATPTNIEVSIIKDSGDRTEFATGAVRDMREGKGRCDLMPLEVVANLLNGRSIPAKEDGQVMHNVKTFLEKNDTYYLYLALEHFADRRYERSIPTMFLEVAKHFEEGAKKYGENNWQKGIPVHCYIDSAVRHYLKWLRGDEDERHDRAFCWNLMCCIWEVDYRPKDEEKTVPIGKGVVSQDAGGISIKVETKLLPVTEGPEMVRLGDCIAGLFDFGGETYLKVNTLVVPNFYVNVLTGTIREFHPDILVTPLEIWKVDDDAEEENKDV